MLHSLIKPLGALVVAELQAKLDPDATHRLLTTLRAGDITGSARAFEKQGHCKAGSLACNQPPPIVGFDDVEVSA